MMTIREIISRYLQKGFSVADSRNLAAEEIFITKIASSEMAEHVTFKGGIVMYNLTKNDRRVTQDIDFDLMRYSIDKESIGLFIEKMNNVDDDFELSIKGELEDLHQEDYQGVRANIIIKDKKFDSLKLKLDIGVHTYSGIEQEKILFNVESSNKTISIKVNPAEQMFAEKLLSLSRLGVISTRYKDIYDLYYLIKECKIDPDKTSNILKLFFEKSKRKPNNLIELQNSIEATLNNERFSNDASKSPSNWIDVEYSEAKKAILTFLGQL